MTKRDNNHRSETKQRLLDASVTLMRARGFNATSVDDICGAAGVTKGGFFHYFKSKEDVAKSALAEFSQTRATMYGTAPFNELADPFDRVIGRIEFAKETSEGNRVTKGCLIGTIAQELASTNPQLRAVCNEAFEQIRGAFAKDLAEAKALYVPKVDFDPQDLAGLYVTIAQGGLLLAKTAQDNAVIVANLDQLRCYIELLFGRRASGAGKRRSASSTVSKN